eukprot:1159796-Pelagomonas_calceolata.AAC.9
MPRAFLTWIWHPKFNQTRNTKGLFVLVVAAAESQALRNTQCIRNAYTSPNLTERSAIPPQWLTMKFHSVMRVPPLCTQMENGPLLLRNCLGLSRFSASTNGSLSCQASCLLPSCLVLPWETAARSTEPEDAAVGLEC